MLSRSTKRRALCLGFIFAAPFLGARVDGQRIAPVPVEDLVQMESPGEIVPMQFSPDGRRLAYAVRLRKTRSEVKADFVGNGLSWAGLGSDIEVSDMQSGATESVTGNRGNNWSPSWSPDGRQLAFLSDRDDSGQAKLWIWDPASRVLRKISDLSIRMTSQDQIKWTKDSRSVYIAVAADTQAAAKIADEKLPKLNDALQRTPRAEQPSVTIYESKGAESGAENNRSLVFDLSSMNRTVVLLDVVTGESRDIAANARIGVFRVSQDENALAYSSPRREETPGAQQLLYDITVVDLLSRQSQRIATGLRLRRTEGFSLSPDGHSLAYREREPVDHGVFVVPAQGGDARNVCGSARSGNANANAALQFDELKNRQRRNSAIPQWDSTGEFLFWIKDGELWRGSLQRGCAQLGIVENHVYEELVSVEPGLAFTRSEGNALLAVTRSVPGNEDGFYRVDPTTGQATKLLERGECYTARCFLHIEGNVAAIAKDGRRVAYIAQDSAHWPEIWTADSAFRTANRLTHLNPALAGFRMGQAQLIDWLDEDGELLHGSLLLPAGYRKGVRYPMVVAVYGGLPLSDTVNQFGGYYGSLGYFHAQLLATRGIAVLFPDAPQRLGTPMRDLAKTILPGINKAIELGIADPSRLGVIGHSYGGYSTLSLLVQTNRFRAAVETSGMADLVGMYGEMASDGTAFGTLAEKGQALMGGTPWEYRERYIENSPVFYLDAVHTPLLIIHGTEDSAVAPFLADELFVGLRRIGAVVSYAKYEGEGHVATGYLNRVDIANRVINWFEKYLLGPEARSR